MPQKKFIEINYHFHADIDDPMRVINLHRPSNLFANVLKNEMQVTFVKHLNYSGELAKDGIDYTFYRSGRQFFHIPRRSHKAISLKKPDIILVQGLIFPLQVIALKRKLGNSCKILLQHHGEVPYRRKKILQKWADRYVDAYLFTSIGNATVWEKAGVIRDPGKCFEFPSASTSFIRKNKLDCQQKVGVNGKFNFIWVGRLNANKDPLTVIRAFNEYSAINAEAHLYLIYQEDDLLQEIKSWIRAYPERQSQIHLIGKVQHEELEIWYNAADYFISGSHHEGGSYALTEAMACGCIPIVTNIPASMKAIDDGRAGYYYDAGDEQGLFSLLSGLQESDQVLMTDIVLQQFQTQLSAQAIAENLLSIIKKIS